MIRIFGVLLLALYAIPALAQDISLQVPFSKPERDLVMEMCEAAKWAARARFDGTCEALKHKFNAAEQPAQPGKEPEKKGK